ncbi:diguanylate cyclase [Sulfurospirillum arcachonense]|uniref:diguanylate cyclase n=1 Tax=Sulfurospirillum arcachonense TaxID=57666 RepID=UPI000469BA09|nr:diguanylate cyclase [Sulfurospirillum arcachonense]
MKKILFVNKNLFFVISIITLLGSFWLYFNFKDVLGKHKDEIQRIEINRAHKTSEKILLNIQPHIIDKVLSLKDNLKITTKISKLLTYYRNDEFKYVYIIYIDENGAYRYLADGSELDERAYLAQKFTPSKTLLWQRVLKEKKEVYDLQDNAEGLWLTYLTPILKDGKVEGILALDVSTQEFNNFSKLITPLNKALNIFFLLIFAIFVVILLQGILFYNELKKSMIDSLTKLYNRHYLEQVSSKIKLDKMAIIMLDVDHFKSVNDRYGHAIGDLVLIATARKLIAATRLEDKVIRYGGEEFLILIKSAKVKQDVIKVAQRIKNAIGKEKIRVNDELSINITVSIGLNLCENSTKFFYDEVKHADEMLYKAKRNGRNRIEIYKN